MITDEFLLRGSAPLCRKAILLKILYTDGAKRQPEPLSSFPSFFFRPPREQEGYPCFCAFTGHPPTYFHDICDKYVISIEKIERTGYYNTILQSGLPVKTIRSPP